MSALSPLVLTLASTLSAASADRAAPEEPLEQPVATAGADQPRRGEWSGSGRDGRFVFAFLPGVTWGVHPAPSVDLPLYFGGALPERGNGRRWTLGYQATLSLGFAERYIEGAGTHRHHITAMTVGERRQHLFGSIGGGVAFMIYSPIIEAEGRVGYVFGKRGPLGRTLGVFGATMRLGWNVGKKEGAPLPQLGLFIGLLVGPKARQRR